MIPISQNTHERVLALPADKRERVDKIVRDHVAACRRAGVFPESLDCVYIEAMGVVAVESREHEGEDRSYVYEARSYAGTYGSPREF